jgi:polyphosphate glucokinase
VTATGFGIDIGGSGIKGCPVDLVGGAFAAERLRTPTPSPSTPRAVARVVADLVASFGDRAGAGAIGVTFPAVIQRGVARTAANVDKSWIGTDVERLLQSTLGRPVRVVNDADAAGYAEVRFGAAKGATGTVFMATLGTGIGSALIVDGVLVPNTELGHMEIRGRDAEKRSAANARVKRGLSWKAWASDLDEHLNAIHRLMWPQLFILGGGVSKNADRFLPRLSVPCEVVAAALRNDAGIVGAAVIAAEARAERDAAIDAMTVTPGSTASATNGRTAGSTPVSSGQAPT